MANEVRVKVILDDDGTIRLTEKSAKKLAGTLDKTGRAAQTADRNIKGTASASSNATKNFSKMAQGITGTLVPAYATLAANVFAISAAFNFFREASDIAILEETQKSFAISTGVGLQRVTDGLREASGGMLDFQKSAEAAAIGVAKGFSQKQLNDLAIGARKASAALGRNFEDSFDRLIRGASKAEPELLDELGITLRLETATNKYAQAVKKTASELTTFEKSQAVLVEVQEQLNKQFGDVEAAINPFVKLQATFRDLVKDITGTVLPAVAGIADILTKNSTTAIAVFGAIGISIAKSALKFDEYKEKSRQALNDSKVAADEAKQKFMAVKDANLQLKASSEVTEKALRQQAMALKESGVSSGPIKKLAEGAKFESARFNKAFETGLKTALKNLDETGRVMKGVWKGATEQQVRDFQASLQRMGKLQETWVQKIVRGYRVTTAAARTSFARIAVLWKATTVGMKAAGEVTAKGIDKAFKLIGFIAIANLAIEAFQKLRENIFDVLKAVTRGFDKGFDIIRKTILRGRIEFEEWFGSAEKAAKLTKELANFEDSTFAQDLFDSSALKGLAQETQNAAREERALKDAIESVESEISSYSDELVNLENALGGVDAVTKATAISTINTSGLINKANNALKKGLSDFSTELPGFEKTLRRAATLIPDLGSALDSVDFSNITTSQLEALFKLLDSKEASARLATSSVTAFDNSLESLTNTLGKVSSAKDLKDLSRAIGESSSTAESAKAALSKYGDVSREFSSEISGALGVKDLEAFKTAIDGIVGRTEELKLAQLDLAISSKSLEGKVGGLAKQAKKRLQVVKEETTLIQKLNDAQALRLIINNDLVKAKDKEAAQDRLDILLKEIELQRVSLQLAKDQADFYKELGKAIGQSLDTELNKAFDALITNAKSFKEAFLGVVDGVLRSMSKKVSEALTNKALGLLPKEIKTFLGIDTDSALIDSQKSLKSSIEDLDRTIQGKTEPQLLKGPKDSTVQAKDVADSVTSQGVTEAADPEKKGFFATLLGNKREVNIQGNVGEVMGEDGVPVVAGVGGKPGKGLIGGLETIFGSFKDGLKTMFAKDGGFLMGLSEIFSGGIDGFGQIFSGIGSAFKGLFGGEEGGGFLSTLAKGAMSLFGFGGVEATAMGGIYQGGISAFANGGIVTRPTMGLVGEAGQNEAVVPLPDGKAIPVNMNGANNNNNVAVNINMATGQAETTGNDQQLAAFGNSIVDIVQREIADQTRPGGLLAR